VLYTKEATGSIEYVCRKLEASAIGHEFGVLGMHNLKERMAAKGVDFDHECRIFEVCNPQQAKRALQADMSISTVLPCRISVYHDGGKVKVAMIRPTALLKMFNLPGIEALSRQVEATMIQIIEEACA
jgi:uncharacterized protein (DUF302 family)